ncbi:MAG: hypothetical protein RIN55_04650 [Tissierellaceae bacterium]|nr:hypothetical protein [Tissierellaceae bacterium]
MNNNLKDIFNNIPIPDELDNSIELGFNIAEKELRNRKTRKTFIAVAASLAIIIGSMSVIGFDRVEAAIRKALQYVPGYNVLVEVEEGKVLALQDKVLYEEDGIYLKITAASKLNKNLNISIESNFEPIENIDVLIKDGDGNIIPSNRWDRSGGGDFWQGDYYFEVEDEHKNYSLLLRDIEVPFTLENTKEVEDFLQLGSNTTNKGISIVAIKKPLKDRLMISLLNQSEGRVVEDYPFENSLWLGQTLDIEKSMYILDIEGNKTYPDIPSSFGNLMSDFYFDIENQEGLKLVLPYVKIRYPDAKTEKVKIKAPKDGEVQSIDKVLTLGEFNIKVINAKSQDDSIVISFKINSLEDEMIDSINVGGINGYGLGPNDETGHMELFINKGDVGRSFSIYFESPTTVLKGDWIIDLD